MALTARHGALTDIGLHRKANEDAFLVAPPLYAVCDGMGGALAGEVASRTAVETLATAFGEGRPLLAAAEAANAAIYTRACANPEQSGMGTTLTAVALEGALGHFVHVGDSRAYLLRDGGLEQLSDDHSLVGEMLREGRLTVAEASAHPHRSILTRALGTEPEVAIDEFEVDLRAGDTLLLCSDGLSGAVSNDEIGAALGLDDPQAAARRLVSLARKHGGHDNITAVVVQLAAGDSTQVEAALAAGAPAAEGPAGTEPVLVFGGASDGGPGGAPGGEQHVRRRLGCLTAMLALAALVGLMGVLTISTVFYVGVDDGRLMVYSGLPAKVGPVRLHAVYRASTVRYTSLTPAQRLLVDQQDLRSRSSAMAMAEALGMWR